MLIASHIKKIIVAFGMVFFAAGASAYPMLNFDGTLNYNYDSGAGIGEIEITGALTGSTDISTPVGSSFFMRGMFTGLGASTSSFLTVGEFSGVAGNDLEIMDGSSSILAGELTGLELLGANGLDWGVLSAEFTPTAGLLQNSFSSPSDFFALTLNLSTIFNGEMYSNNFSGAVDGILHSRAVTVPEPGMLALYLIALLLLAGFYRRSGFSS